MLCGLLTLRISRSSQGMCPFASFIPIGFKTMCFVSISLRPESFRECRKAFRVGVHVSWYLSDFVLASYGQNISGGGALLSGYSSKPNI